MNIDFKDENTNRIVSNYAEGRTCEHCTSCEHNEENDQDECSTFGITLPESFSCLDFKKKGK